MSGSKIALIVIGVIAAITVLVVVLTTCNFAGGMVNNGLQTIQQQYSPSALLAKYESFKDEYSQCESLLADANQSITQANTLSVMYSGVPRNQWSQQDSSQWAVYQNAAQGALAQYNNLASDYNANMSKFNYAFCNVGTLPAGATEPLPRQALPYQYEVTTIAPSN